MSWWILAEGRRERAPLRTSVDLVSQDYYAQELRHQQRMNAVARTAALPVLVACALMLQGCLVGAVVGTGAAVVGGALLSGARTAETMALWVLVGEAFRSLCMVGGLWLHLRELKTD